MQPVTIAYQQYVLTTDRSQLQPEAVHQWLSTESYWSRGIPWATVKTAFDHSFVIGALHEGQQVAFARLVTDYATFAYLADVYVMEVHRGKGIGKKMMELLMAEPWIGGLRRVMLATLDAHQLYEQFGFTAPAFPQRLMEITRPGMYENQPAAAAPAQTETP